MSEKIITEKASHHAQDEAELRRLESRFESNSDGGTTQTVEVTEVETEEIQPDEAKSQPWRKALVISLVAVVVLAAIVFWWSRRDNPKTDVAVTTETEKKVADESGAEVKLSPETLASAGIVTEGVTSRPAVALLDTTGTVEADPQQTQAVSPLVAGRVEQVYVSIGSRVSAGDTLATIASTEITEALGKLHEAENRLDIARKNLLRVRRAENRVGVLQAKAKLDEAEATLKRTQRLIELGAGAGKDLISAQTAYQTAKADYDFQRNITLNKEIQEAEGEVKTTEIDVKHQRQSLQSIGVNIGVGDEDVKNVALVPIRAPLSGIVTERLISAGSGVQSGQQMFMLSNISSVWITANVPQQQLGLINVGSIAQVQTTALGDQKINAHVTYIDPSINEDTRTAKVRLAVANPGERLRAGMFVEVGFQIGTSSATGEELVVPSDAVQRVGEKNIVFVPKKNEPGAFEVREIEAGSDTNGYTRIKSGLELGEMVVTKGSFTLKTQLQKGELGEE